MYSPLRRTDDNTEQISTEIIKKMILALDIERDACIFDMDRGWYDYKKNPETSPSVTIFEKLSSQNAPLALVQETNDMPPFDFLEHPVDLILGIRAMTPGDHRFTIYWRDIFLGECTTTDEKPIARFHRIIPYMGLRLYGPFRIEHVPDPALRFRVVYATIETEKRSFLFKKMVLRY